jgi:hypothetical protein
MKAFCDAGAAIAGRRRAMRRLPEPEIGHAPRRSLPTFRTVIRSLIALVAIGANAQNQPVVFQSPATRTALLELFTSEGCSSCPPAETWLTNLKASPGLWKDFVPVAFHVDYWDNLGWRDPWSAREFSDRQRAYAAAWRNNSVYTPGFVLNGKECPDWSRLTDLLKDSGAPAGRLKVSSPDLEHWQVWFTPLAPGRESYEVHAALLASGLTSDVKAGENRGRHLTHDFVVTALKKTPLKTYSDAAWGQVVLHKTAKGQQGRRALAVWVTRAGGTEPLQAVGGWLR